MWHYFNFGEYSFLNSNIVDSDTSKFNQTSVTFYYPCSDKQNCSGFEIKLNPGHYLFEVFGAQGSQEAESQKGGLGGYGRAEVTIPKTFPLYLVVGSQGKWTDSDASEASFNGGGQGYKSGPGGGATDFRISENDLRTRFLIAGGGGAQGIDSGSGHEAEISPQPVDPDGGFDEGDGFLKRLHETRQSGAINERLSGDSNQGGSGGGTIGGDGSDSEVTGGTQNSGGIGYISGSFGSGCIFHDAGAHGGSGGGLFGGSCGKDSGVSGSGGSGFFYSENKTELIDTIKTIKISNGSLLSGQNFGDGYAIITLLSSFSKNYRKRINKSYVAVIMYILKYK
ncbi:loricrin, putative [Trichomonas vaginalis G3]|uniref:receptor protein-tyrosine kinase n=1 Tax=Trichomonas vaginalis (strain ATCC PRA-98 / G3) TaxID=412133 RepID=A2EBP6_TRIV3|nr:glycine-rich protein family [Trichomonas vaginalis G3]EAY09963.1 loricrin, putative [Trichomonas vaginalis G3]KAI5523119.1 glycine-rich protein family [Trichomonas vaginalis G3]|eukprot:XP_001322186.1 loricrin [Trichomonas vaginalis G3]